MSNLSEPAIRPAWGIPWPAQPANSREAVSQCARRAYGPTRVPGVLPVKFRLLAERRLGRLRDLGDVEVVFHGCLLRGNPAESHRSALEYPIVVCRTAFDNKTLSSAESCQHRVHRPNAYSCLIVGGLNQATCRIMFSLPKGFGARRMHSGSSRHWPSTRKR